MKINCDNEEIKLILELLINTIDDHFSASKKYTFLDDYSIHFIINRNEASITRKVIELTEINPKSPIIEKLMNVDQAGFQTKRYEWTIFLDMKEHINEKYEFNFPRIIMYLRFVLTAIIASETIKRPEGEKFYIDDMFNNLFNFNSEREFARFYHDFSSRLKDSNLEISWT